MLVGLGRWVAQRRFWVLMVWALIALAGASLGGSVFDQTQAVSSVRPGTASALAQARLDELDPEGEVIVAVLSGRHINDTDLVTSAVNMVPEIRSIPGVAEVKTVYTSQFAQVSPDQMSSLVTVELDPELTEKKALAVAEHVSAALHRIDAPQVLIGGELLAEHRFGEQAIADAAFGESVALVMLCGVLVVILGGVVAGSLPLAAALATIASSLLSLRLMADAMAVSEYAVNVVTLLGIGLSVDYSLLLMLRFRDERAAAPDAPLSELLARTVATAGRAVVVSGLAVVAALAGLFAFADPLLSAMALGGALVAGLAMIAGLTLVPALIAVARRRIPASDARRTWVRRRSSRTRPEVLARLARFGQRRPAWVAFGVATGLLLLSAPVLQGNLANSDARSLPTGSQERQVQEVVERDFDSEPITVVIEADSTKPAVRTLLNKFVALTGVKDVYKRSETPAGVTVADVIPTDPAAGEQTQQLVRDIRAQTSPVPVLVAGSAPELVDAKDATADQLPMALLVIVVTTALLLFVLTGSVVVPVKALVMNILTLLATLGVLVAVFQWGWGSSVLGFEPLGAMDLTTPLLLFVLIFGLSMDYEVFLLARIKEEWDRRRADDARANDRAVLAGIVATGPVVTAAALSIGIVFLGFALGELVAVKEIGVGMTVAVLLDVTVIRGLLLPAVMTLLGPTSWWPAGRSSRRGRPDHREPNPKR